MAFVGGTKSLSILPSFSLSLLLCLSLSFPLSPPFSLLWLQPCLHRCAVFSQCAHTERLHEARRQELSSRGNKSATPTCTEDAVCPWWWGGSVETAGHAYAEQERDTCWGSLARQPGNRTSPDTGEWSMWAVVA